MRRLPWLADFNTHLHADPAAEAPPPPPQDEPDPRIEAWHEGFLAGYRAARADTVRHSQHIADTLTRRIAAIEQDLAAAADKSAATIGGLLIDILAAALPPGWSATRLQPITDAIRPIFDLEPRLHLCPKQPGGTPFRDLPALYAALESGDWDLALRWHQAAADIDPAAMTAGIGQAVAFPGAANPTVAEPHHAEPDAPPPVDSDPQKVPHASE
ncbi:MAG: hypothetical protein ACJ8AW_42585 [Rhodopila sp.]